MVPINAVHDQWKCVVDPPQDLWVHFSLSRRDLGEFGERVKEKGKHGAAIKQKGSEKSAVCGTRRVQDDAHPNGIAQLEQGYLVIVGDDVIAWKICIKAPTEGEKSDEQTGLVQMVIFVYLAVVSEIPENFRVSAFF